MNALYRDLRYKRMRNNAAPQYVLSDRRSIHSRFQCLRSYPVLSPILSPILFTFTQIYVYSTLSLCFSNKIKENREDDKNVFISLEN